LFSDEHTHTHFSFFSNCVAGLSSGSGGGGRAHDLREKRKIARRTDGCEVRVGSVSSEGKVRGGVGVE
jgi:hypothetical protein